MTNGSQASPLDEYQWKNRVLVVSAPAGDSAAKEQRQIYEAAAKGIPSGRWCSPKRSTTTTGPCGFDRGFPQTAGASSLPRRQ